MNEIWPWVTLALLGAYHGLNPAMGWLFAVALGLQAQRRVAVLQALVPIALGHAAAVVLAIVVVGLAQVLVPGDHLRKSGACHPQARVGQPGPGVGRRVGWRGDYHAVRIA